MNLTGLWNQASRHRTLSGSTLVFPRTILAQLHTRRSFVNFAGLSSRTLATPLTWSLTFSSFMLRNIVRPSNRTVMIDLDQAVPLQWRRPHTLQSAERSPNQTPFSNESVKHMQLVDAAANFICQGLQPLSIVDELAFRRLLEIAEPRFKLPHHTYFTDTVIPAKYRAARAVSENQLAAVENCAVTTDLWTSLHQQRAYISLTAHFVDSNFNHQRKCLQTLEVSRIMILVRWRMFFPQCSMTGKTLESCVEASRTMLATWSMPLDCWQLIILLV